MPQCRNVSHPEGAWQFHEGFELDSHQRLAQAERTIVEQLALRLSARGRDVAHLLMTGKR
jgi:hypothetical protein